MVDSSDEETDDFEIECEEECELAKMRNLGIFHIDTKKSSVL